MYQLNINNVVLLKRRISGIEVHAYEFLKYYINVEKRYTDLQWARVGEQKYSLPLMRFP
jgi:hypothetical protein